MTVSLSFSAESAVSALLLMVWQCWWHDFIGISLSVSPSLAFRLLAKLIALMHWSGSVRCWVWDTGTNLRGIHFQLSERQLYRADGPRNISRSAGSVHTSEHTHPCLLDSSELCRDSGLHGCLWWIWGLCSSLWNMLRASQVRRGCRPYVQMSYLKAFLTPWETKAASVSVSCWCIMECASVSSVVLVSRLISSPCRLKLVVQKLRVYVEFDLFVLEWWAKGKRRVLNSTKGHLGVRALVI